MSSRLEIWSQRQPDKASRQYRSAVTVCPGVFPFSPCRPTSREKRTSPRPWSFPGMRTRTRRNWRALVHAQRVLWEFVRLWYPLQASLNFLRKRSFIYNGGVRKSPEQTATTNLLRFLHVGVQMMSASMICNVRKEGL